MTLQIEKVEILPANPALLSIRFAGGEQAQFPLHPPIIAVLNAGGWLMREYLATSFEQDLGGSNPLSRRIRMMDAGERAPQARGEPAQAMKAAAP